jgi:GT2 family glycosyltransferase
MTGAPEGAPVSVVVPHYGDPRTPVPLVTSLLDQRGAPALEVIVVDDASPEALPDLPGATVVRRSVNGGFGSAVNSGAAAATGELLLVLNSDLAVGRDFVALLLAGARGWLPAVVSPRVVGPDGVEEWTGRRFPRIRHQVAEWLVPLARWRPTSVGHRLVGHDTTVHGGEGPVDWVVGAAMLMPLADFRAVGGFDEAYFMNAEEIDLQRRLRERRGLPSVLLAEPVVTHLGGGSTDPSRGRDWLVDARMTYAAAWGGRRRLRAALAAATLVNLVWNLGRQAAGREVSAWSTARAELRLLTRNGTTGPA